MMIKKMLSLFLVLISCNAVAQEEFYYKTYDWKSKPESVTLTSEELEKDQVTLSEKKFTHFFFKENRLVKCVLEHKTIRLNNDKAIENNNKYYVSNYGSLEVILQKARVINPDGKIIELSAKDIQISKDENGNPEYQYFAFEGIVIGSVIEYFHVMLYPGNFSGDEVRVQSSYLKKNVSHEIIIPPHLEFKVKSINGLPNFVQDTVEENYTRYFMNTDLIEGVEEEASAAYGASIQKYYYMLYKNISSNKSNIYNYQDVTKNIHGNMFTPLTSKESKKINAFIKSSKADEAKTVLEKVRLLESHLKGTIGIQEEDFEGGFDISKILDNKLTTEDGATKLMMNCLRNLDIKFELVLTCDRNENKFISDFQGYNFLKYYLIYINDLDAYYESNVVSRLGYPSYAYMYNEGLFIKEIKVGEVVSSIGAIKKINGKKMEDSADDIFAHVVVNDDKSSVSIDLERRSTGYKAVYQSFISYVGETQRNEIKEEFLNYIDNETKPENVVFVNDSSAFYGEKPFIGKCTLKSSNFIEQAGDKLLFKIGMLIGPQANLYNSNERKLPVEIEHLKEYNRVITFEIPAGYSVKNLNDLNLSVQPDFNNKTMGFVSTYEVKDNNLIVTVKEWYGTIIIPVSEYKSYENVVNAAADFNKLVVVLQKM
jgi:hypothetical protein